MAWTREIHARKAVQLAAQQMAQGMAREKVERQQNDVHQQYDGTDAHTKSVFEEEAVYRVIPEKRQEDDRQVHEVSMRVLQDEGKFSFASVAAAGFFRHGAARWIEKKGAVIGFAIVVAGNAKTERPRQNQQRGGKWPVVVMDIDQRGVKRGKIWPPLEVCSLKGSEGCVDTEPTEYHNYGNYLDPPSITLRGALDVGLPKRSHSSS